MYETLATQEIHRSSVRSDVQTVHPRLAPVIAWADDHPVVWEIVTHKRSKAFGIGSSAYIGWAQKSMAPEAVLERARHLMSLVTNAGRWSHANSIFAWRAKFTLEHYNEKGFTGGFFQQHDARYPRSCLTLDYTPATFETVLDRFCGWMDGYYDTACVTVNGRCVRTFGRGGEGHG